MNSAEKNNRVYLNGEIVSEAAFSHEVYGEGFYEMSVLVKRLSGQADKLPVDWLLLDTYVKHAYGGSGKTFDWSLIGEVDHPYFLAGGLNETNVQKAAQTGAYALDLSSGIETDDVKDIDKMRRVSALVKGANQ